MTTDEEFTMNPMPKPTFSQHDFRKATSSQPNGDCVRVARRDGWVELRDDKTVFGADDDHRLVFTAEEFDAYLNGERTGDKAASPLVMERRSDGRYGFRRADGTIELVFDEPEFTAFLDGVAKHEFDAPAYAA